MSDPSNCTIVTTSNRVHDSTMRALYPECEVIHPENYIFEGLIEVLRDAWQDLMSLQKGTQKTNKK